MQSLYEWDFYNKKRDLHEIVRRNLEELGPGLEDQVFLLKIINGVKDHLEEIDKIIIQFAPNWPIDRIASVDRNILRIGVYELFFGDRKKVPYKVAINEAVELAKRFGGNSSPRFVNGVLGTAYRKLIEEKEKKKKKENKP
jgi:N utilization substance protein B